MVLFSYIEDIFFTLTHGKDKREKTLNLPLNLPINPVKRVSHF